MEFTKQAINKYKSRINGLDGYGVCISKVEKNVSINPDIAIEACKSLIEGLSKKALELLSEDYQTKKQLRKDCDNNLKKLVRAAFEHIYKNRLELNIYYSLANIIIDKNRIDKFKEKGSRSIHNSAEAAILKISAIRDNRGDISHGRIYPKKEESDIYFAQSIMSITDGICSFMIHEFASSYIDISIETVQLDYLELDEFNQWLNEKHNVLTVKADISKLLFKNAYEKYEEFYYSDYLPEIELEAGSEDIEDIAVEKIPIVKEEVTREPSNLVNTYNEEEVWGSEAIENLDAFTTEENLNADAVKKIIGDYLFSEKEPLTDAVIASMNERPSLKERASVAKKLTAKLVTFAEALSKNATRNTLEQF